MRGVARWGVAAVAVLGLAWGLTSCSEDKEGDSAFGDRAVVEHVALQVAIPTHQALAEAAGALADRLSAMCAAGHNAALADAREAWRATRNAWHHTEAFGFGPVDMSRLGSAIAWPADHEAIAETLAEVEADEAVSIDAAFVANLGSSRKGLGALEMLLFDPWTDSEAFTAAEARRCAYAEALALDVDRAATALSMEWVSSYGPAMAAADADPFPRQQAVIDALVNRHAEQAEGLLVSSLGGPLGEKTEGVPQPDDVSHWRSAHARAEIAATLEGMRAVYTGVDGGPGLNDGIRRRQPALAADLLAAFDAAITAVRAIEEPLKVAVVEDPEAVRAALEATREVKRLIAADVANVLGVTRTFSDNDGD